MNDKILVLTATLGVRETLKKTIDSVRFIGGNNVKHVIIAPKERISLIKERYNDIECIAEPKEKKGIFAALNYGFNIYGHDYKYLTFINDDDFWLPNYSCLINNILNNPKLDFVYGKVQFVNQYGEKIKSQASSSQFYSFLSLFRQGIILLTQQSTIIKSDLFFRIGGFDETYKLVSDTKFWIDLSLLKPTFKYINKECAAYMIQKGQQLSSDKVLQKTEMKNILAEYKNIDMQVSFFEKFYYRIINLYTYINNVILKY